MFPSVIQPVADANDGQPQGDLQDDPQNQPADLAEQTAGRHPLQMGQCRNPLSQINPDNRSDENQFENRKQQLDQIFAGKEIFQPGHGVQLFGFEFQGLCGEIQAADQNIRPDTGDHQDQQKGTDDEYDIQYLLTGKGVKCLAVFQHRDVAGKPVANLILAPLYKPGTQQRRRTDQCKQCRRREHFLALRDLALLTGFFYPPRRRLFGFVIIGRHRYSL
jgi:hypothetical protein